MKPSQFPCAAIGRALMLSIASLASMSGAAAADSDGHAHPPPRLLLKAARVFDGVDLLTDAAVLVANGKVQKVGPIGEVRARGAKEIDLGDATLLPGFIELHAHVAFQNISHDTILRHGVTTVRDVGGPLLAPAGGDGDLRLLTAGPIITAHGGYPIPVFGGHGHGHGEIAAPVSSVEQAQAKVQELAAGGAAIIKIALDPGGEAGAPWTTGHTPSTPPPWPMLSLDMTKAVVNEAHRLGLQVAAHLAEPTGVVMALDAGVDEWAHVPCETIPDDLLSRAAAQGVRVLTTIDTLSHCPGIHMNTVKLAQFGAKLYYGAEIAHTEIPWGIDAQELHLMLHLTGASVLDVFRSATSEAGKVLNLAPLGTLSAGAPADIIAVPGDAFQNFKPLEYPDLVISGGRVVVNRFPHDEP